MTGLDELLGFEDTPEQRRANALVENDMRMLRSLIDLRERQRVSQEEVARRLGVSQPAIAAFERYDNDPKLSTIRRYAHAIGALIDHTVNLDDGQPTDTSNTTMLTVEPSQGIALHLLVSRPSGNSAASWTGKSYGQFTHRVVGSDSIRR